ncbi:MAG: 23S rRNA (guanosine(2251)-2'-O)-methyltransferase RlmB [Alphaproteobacteria bacterium]
MNKNFFNKNKSKNFTTNKSFKKNNFEVCGYFIAGKNPVFMALKANRRKFFAIYVTKNSFQELKTFLEKNNLQKHQELVRLVDNQKIDELVGKNFVHQGIALETTKLMVKEQIDFLEELYQLPENNLPKLLMLDQICDPQNVGAIIRSATAFGFNKIIFCNHNSVIENATVVKASAGNIEFADLIVVNNFNNFLEKIKKIGYWSFGLDSHASISIKEVNQYRNVALVVGAEGEGIRQLVKKNCDFLLKVETSNEVESLNVSVACAIALYQITSS